MSRPLSPRARAEVFALLAFCAIVWFAFLYAVILYGPGVDPAGHIR